MMPSKRLEIVIRFYPGSNPEHRFFRTQAALDEAAGTLGLSREFHETKNKRMSENHLSTSPATFSARAGLHALES